MRLNTTTARMLLGLIAVALIALTYRAVVPRPKPPFEVAFWVWQGPFQFSDPQLAELRELGVRRLFVRAGTFTQDGKQVLLRLPQQWRSKAPGMTCHLVFNFDAGVIHHFESFDLATMADAVRSRVETQVAAARAAGIQVGGVQFDFDVPTRLLPRYGEFLHLVRAGSPELRPKGGLAVSSTGLVTWLRHRELNQVCRELDFFVPQFYEGVTGGVLDAMRPISDLQTMQRNIGLAEGLACPYLIGVPSYGHALLYDDHDKLLALYSGLTPADSLRHPSFRLLDAFPANRKGKAATSAEDAVGEEMLFLRAIRPARDGRGLGDTLAYTIPTPDLLRRYLAEAKRLQSPSCLGAILFRYPEPGQSLALPMESVHAVLTGKATQPNLNVRVRSGRDTFDLIDTDVPRADAPRDVYLDVTNVGNAPTYVAPDAVEVTVRFDVGGFDGARKRDMDEVIQVDEQTLRFRKGYLAPGQTLHVGPIRLIGQAKSMTVSWQVRPPEGFGEIARTLSPIAFADPIK